MSFSGFLVSFMMRTDINIAMVAMAKMRVNSDNSSNITELSCYAAMMNSTELAEDHKKMVKCNFSPYIILCSSYLYIFN